MVAAKQTVDSRLCDGTGSFKNIGGWESHSVGVAERGRSGSIMEPCWISGGLSCDTTCLSGTTTTYTLFKVLTIHVPIRKRKLTLPGWGGGRRGKSGGTRGTRGTRGMCQGARLTLRDWQRESLDETKIAPTDSKFDRILFTFTTPTRRYGTICIRV